MQISNDVENFFKGIPGFDMSYQEVKNLFRTAREEHFNFFFRTPNIKDEGKRTIQNEAKTITFKAHLKSNLSSYKKSVISTQN